MTRRVALLFVFAAVLGGRAQAQERTLRFEEQKIVGKIQKPEIQILFTRQNLTPPYKLELKESFLPRILQAVEAKPF